MSNEPKKTITKEKKTAAKKGPKQPQEKFIDASVEDKSPIELSLENNNGVTKDITISRWTLRQQFKQGVVLSRVMRGLIPVLIRASAPATAKEGEEVNLNAILRDQDLLLTMLSAHADDIFSLCISAVRPSFSTDAEAEAFVDDLNPSDCFIILFTLVHVNRAAETTDKSKKKLDGLVTMLMPGTRKNQ